MSEDDNGMVEVEAAVDGVKDNGHTYAAGDRFHMHRDLVAAHVAAGQVRAAGEAKQAAAPRDKQQVGGGTK